MLYAQLSALKVSASSLDSVLGHIETEIRTAIERRGGSRGTSLQANTASGEVVLESFWDSGKAMQESAATGVLTKHSLTGGAESAVVTENYRLAAFEHHGGAQTGAAVQITRLSAEPSALDDAIEVFGDTVVPALADMEGFLSAMLLADRDSGRTIIQSVWLDTAVLRAGRGAPAIQAEAMATAGCAIRRTDNYGLLYDSAQLG